MDNADQDLEKRFFDELMQTYHDARKLKPPLNSRPFLRMLGEYGGKGTADRLLATANPSDGFRRLFERGKESMQLAVEYQVLKNPWRQMFSDQQLAVARKRLIEYEVDLPPDDITRISVDSPLAEEVRDASALREGAVKSITINAYERSFEAREKCIAHYGARCVVCELDFGHRYGPIADGLIHVHHLKLLSSIKADYQVDPINDLRPVCPNCHAVIHHGGANRSIEEVKRLIMGGQSQRNADR